MSARFDTHRITGPGNTGTDKAAAELASSPADVRDRLQRNPSLLDATRDALGSADSPEIQRLMGTCAGDHAAVRRAVIHAIDAGRRVRIDCHLLDSRPTEDLVGIRLHTAVDAKDDALVVHVEPAAQ